MIRAAILVLLAGAAQTARGQALFLSVSDDTGTQLGGLTFSDGDVVEYDGGSGTATVFFDEASISPDADVDAFHRLADGSILVSTLFSGRTLGSLTFNDGDLVRYVPGTNTASIYFISEASFASSADIDAVSLDAAGNIVLSTDAANTLGGLSYTDGDLIAYDPNTAMASLLVSEAALFDDGDGNISGVHAMDDGTYLLSFTADTEAISGTVYSNGDVVHYDPVADSATLYFAESLFSDGVNSHDVDAVYVSPPAPSSGTGLTLFLSDNNNIGNQLGGLTFNDGDVVTYDVDADSAAVFFAEANITPNADIDAFHLFPDGSMLLSVLFNGRTLGGLTFDDGDLVRYDPVTDTASIYFIGEASFGVNADISGVSIDQDGHILLATRENNTLGGLSYNDGDLIVYDPDTATASLVIPEAQIFDDGDGDINAIHLMPDGTYLFSFTATTEMISGQQFNDGDVIRYDAVADTATLVFSETTFTDGSTSHEIDAVYVPPPGDCNATGAADLDDHGAGYDCLAGPDTTPPAGCACFDLDGDGDNDLNDFANFSRGFGG